MLAGSAMIRVARNSKNSALAGRSVWIPGVLLALTRRATICVSFQQSTFGKGTVMKRGQAHPARLIFAALTVTVLVERAGRLEACPSEHLHRLSIPL